MTGADAVAHCPRVEPVVSPPSPQDTVLQWLVVGDAQRALAQVVRYGLADAIGDGAVSAADIASTHPLDIALSARLLRAATRLGLVREMLSGHFILTAAGGLLRSDVDGSLLTLVRLHTPPTVDSPWAALPRTDSETARLLAERIDFGRFVSVTDVYGGDATVLVEVLIRHPALRGVVFERPKAAPDAAARLQERGLAKRCRIVEDDGVVGLPCGSESFLLDSVLGGLSDDEATVLLRRCREAMPRRGRVFVVETLPPSFDDVAAAAMHRLRDLDVLVVGNGWTRTRSQLGDLCARAGLEVESVVDLAPPQGVTVIEGRPV